VLLNLLAFVAWGVFGLGLGAVLRSQIVSVIAAIAVYAGSFGTELVFTALYNSSTRAGCSGRRSSAPRSPQRS
jgi:hypothetical protein